MSLMAEASLSKIKVMTHDVTQTFSGMHKEITNSQPQFIVLQRGQLGSNILNVDVFSN